ncbi:MAG: shikimate kinase AroL [Deltaproteobacteria bacterium]
MKVILIGYRATGKSTVGRLLAGKLKLPFADTDSLIESRAGMPIKELVAREGWEAFREKERDVVASLRQTGIGVVATGGGVVLSGANRDLLKKMGILIYLKSPLQEIVERLRQDARGEQTRPQFTSETLVAETMAMLAERVPIYESVADFTVDTAGKSIVQINDDIYRHLLESGVLSDLDQTNKRSRKKR